MPAKKQETKNQETTFESAIARLESIVEQMESDKLPLEDLLVRYEEGIKLVNLCSEKLQTAEKRIEIITREAGGKNKLAEFAADDTTGSAKTADVRLF
jgi:exodeoxyribonuclease VII small subunit